MPKINSAKGGAGKINYTADGIKGVSGKKSFEMSNDGNSVFNTLGTTLKFTRTADGVQMHVADHKSGKTSSLSMNSKGLTETHKGPGFHRTTETRTDRFRHQALDIANGMKSTGDIVGRLGAHASKFDESEFENAIRGHKGKSSPRKKT